VHVSLFSKNVKIYKPFFSSSRLKCAFTSPPLAVSSRHLVATALPLEITDSKQPPDPRHLRLWDLNTPWDVWTLERQEGAKVAHTVFIIIIIQDIESFTQTEHFLVNNFKQVLCKLIKVNSNNLKMTYFQDQ